MAGIVVASSNAVVKTYFTAGGSESNGEDVASSGKYAVNPTVSEEILGCFLCLMAAAGEVGVILNRQVTKRYVPLMQYSAATSVGVTICTSLMSMLIEGTHLTGICNHCIFGWLSHKWVSVVLLFGLVVGVVCIAGFNYAVSVNGLVIQ
jgi:hypothetical protein